MSGPALMRSAFDPSTAGDPIKVTTELTGGSTCIYELVNDNEPYSSWENSSQSRTIGGQEDFISWFTSYLDSFDDDDNKTEMLRNLKRQMEKVIDMESGELLSVDDPELFKIDLPAPKKFQKFESGSIDDFIIFSPEDSSLRTFEKEGQIEPLGVNGEGLLKLLSVISSQKDKKKIKAIKDSLKLFPWFEDFKIVKGRAQGKIQIFDHFLCEDSPSFDQRSANEGFLFLAFYFALFTSELTPRFFAVDNVDTSLNPKLCEAMVRRLTTLATDHNKQALLTTHNAAVLDGLDIGDPEQRLFIVSRGPRGRTRVRRFEKKPSSDRPRRLSELFLSGAMGGLPKGF